MTRTTYIPLLVVLLTTIGCARASAQAIAPEDADQHWHQPSGPQGTWRVDGEAPIRWSVTRDEQILWRTPMPESGQSNVTVWGSRAFVTTLAPIKTEADKANASDIVCFCLDTRTGKVLWQRKLPGTQVVEPAGGFSDASVFGPVTNGQHVWFFNRCGSMGCFDFEGNEIWRRVFRLRFKHNNRQAEPVLVGNTILYVEVLDKDNGSKIQLYAADQGRARQPTPVPPGVDPKSVWTYVHGIDAKTGKVLWHESAGTSVHTTPVIGRMQDGTAAIVHARGGGHQPFEKPFGISLTSLAAGQEGQTIWSTPLTAFGPEFSSHWDSKHVYGFRGGKHLVLSTNDGSVLREQPLYENANLWKYEPAQEDWSFQAGVAVKAGKSTHPNTNGANIVVGPWHYFLAHNARYIGRVHTETGKVEYLEVPAQLIASDRRREDDKWLWGRGQENHPKNASGIELGGKGSKGIGWGHISAASPLLVGRYLYCPVITGTVYVLDTQTPTLSPKSLVAINDLGAGGETWSLASLSYADGKLFAHTMREVICIGEASKAKDQ